MALGEQLASFFAKFTFDVQDDKLKGLDNNLKQLGQKLIGFKSIAGAVGVALQQVLSLKFAKITAEEEKFSKLNGVLRENVDELKLWANQANVSEETVKSALSQIAKQKQDLMTMKSIPMWVRFGIDPKQSPDKVLKDILAKVSRFTNDTQKQMAMLNRLGINSELVLMFQKGADAIDDATRELLKFKQTNAESSTELMGNVTTLKSLLSGFLQGLNGLITPIMNFLVKALTDISKKVFVILQPVLEVIGAIVKKIADWLKWIWGYVGEYVSIIVGVVAAIGAVILAVKGLLAVLGLVKAALLIINLLGNPFFWIGAAIAGLIALWKWLAPESFEKTFKYIKLFFNDVKDFFDGVENTVTGDIVNAVKKFFKEAWDGCKQFFTSLWDICVAVYDWVVEKIAYVGKLFKQTINAVKEGLSFEGLKNEAKRTGEQIAGMFGFGDDKKKESQPNSNKGLLPARQQEKLYSEQRNENNVKNDIKNEINITTQSDKPNEVASAVVNKLGGIQYQTKISSEEENASLMFNVITGNNY